MLGGLALVLYAARIDRTLGFKVEADDYSLERGL